MSLHPKVRQSGILCTAIQLGAPMAEKTTLRAQWNSRQGKWRIVKKTNTGAGGWAMFGNSEGYTSISEAVDKIKGLIEKFPDQYQEG